MSYFFPLDLIYVPLRFLTTLELIAAVAHELQQARDQGETVSEALLEYVHDFWNQLDFATLIMNCIVVVRTLSRSDPTTTTLVAVSLDCSRVSTHNNN